MDSRLRGNDEQSHSIPAFGQKRTSKAWQQRVRSKRQHQEKSVRAKAPERGHSPLDQVIRRPGIA
jgi:hypothetical protein